MMKRIFYLFFLFASILNAQKQEKQLLPANLMVQDAVFLEETSYAKNEFIDYPIVQLYENKAKINIIHTLADAALNRKYQALEPHLDEFFPYSAFENKKPASLTQYKSVKHIPGHENGTYLMTANGEQKVIGLSFLENWSFNTERMHFEKEVLGYEFVTSVEKYGSQLYDVPFRVLYPENMDGNKNDYKLSCHVEYEFLLAPVFAYNRKTDPDKIEEIKTSGYFDLPVKNYVGNNYRHAPLLTGYTKRRLTKKILDKVLNQEIEAYDYSSGKELFIDELENRLFSIDTIQMPGQSNEKIIKTPHPIEEYNSLIFIEDWYINPQNAHVKKQVKGLALVRGYMDYERHYEIDKAEDIQWKKEVVFWVKFDCAPKGLNE